MPDLLDKLQQGKKPEELLTPEEFDEKNMEVQKYITEIMNETGLSKEKIMEKVDDKKKELKGLISTEGALFVISKELGVSIKKSDQGFGATPEKAPIPLTEGSNANHTDIDTKGASKGFGGTTTEKFFNEKVKPFGAGAEGKGTTELGAQSLKYGQIPVSDEVVPPTPAQPKITTDIIIHEPLDIEDKKESIRQTQALIEFTAANALGPDDFWLPPSAKKKALTRSGCNKLATIFNISTETISIEVKKEIDLQGNDDIVAYAKVKATRPGGSSVIAVGMKALSEYGRGASKMKMKDIKGTAETRAANRAIQNAIGFVPKDYMVVTKEEIDNKSTGGFGG